METPHTLDLRQWVKPDVEGTSQTRLNELRFSQSVNMSLIFVYVSGLTSVEEVATGVEHILADMIAKDPDTLTHVKTL